MKKILLSLLFCFIIISMFSQSSDDLRHLKYVSTAPDGSIAITFTDDFEENNIKFKTAERFYMYQLLDIKTGEPVFSSSNNSTVGFIDKSNITPGVYNLKLFTRSFIITTEITLSSQNLVVDSNSIASTD